MGMKEKCVCSTGRGFWDEQNCWLCKLCIWFLMNLSLPAHWLLSCYCWQETSSINTHTLAHIHKNFICSAKISCIRRHAQNFILWRSEGSLQTQGRNVFTRAEVWYWLTLFLCSTRAIYIISESFMYHWAYTCDWGALHVGLLCSDFFPGLPSCEQRAFRAQLEGNDCVCACADMCIRVWAQVWDASLQPDPTVSIFTQYSEIWRKATCFNIYGCGQTLNPPTLSKSRDSMHAHAPTDG